MDPVNPLNGLAELLRKRIASEATALREGRASSQRREAEKTDNSERPGVAELRNRISDAIRSIEPDDPARNRKALRVFVESVLAWQFGSDVLNDPRFMDLVANVQSALEKDPAVAESLNAVIGQGKEPLR